MYLIDIAGLKILFTGDYSREEDRHLVKASIPKDIKVDVLICESTFGTAVHVPRVERELALMKGITTVLDRGGRALLPVFALGTAQELLLILDEYWAKHAKYQKTPIYYASNLARRCMLVYQTYISSMNDNIKRLFQERIAEAERSGKSTEGVGPWDFQFVRALKSLERFEDVGPCVMLASPGMMQNGASRELLERWAPDEKNGVIITGYSVEGTMAQILLNEPEYVAASMSRKRDAALTSSRQADEQRIPRRCSIQETSFAAHVDGAQNKEFVEEVGAEVVILVHGAKHNMTRFKSKLLSLSSSKAKAIKVFTPANCDELKIPFRREKFAKVVGRLAQIPPPRLMAPNGSEESKVQDDRIVSGVLVQNGFNLTLMAPEDLKEYAGLTTTTINFKKRLFCSAGVDLIRWGLEGMFGGVKDVSASASNGSNGNGTLNGHSDKTTTFLVMDCVTVDIESSGEVVLEWEGNVMNDSIADSVLSVLLQMETGMVGVKRTYPFSK
jgi:cleavage and polyadenylation specificity factor subunit 3